MGDAPTDAKICVTCGRTMQWRKAWRHCWDDVKYCSDACRKGPRRAAATETTEAAILELLAQRARDATICPSEAARLVGGDAWREHMEPVRDAARRLAARGIIEVTQGGQVVDAAAARGPIRLRLKRSPQAVDRVPTTAQARHGARRGGE